MFKIGKILLVFIALFLFVSCDKNPLDIPIDNIKVDITLNRFEQELKNSDRYKLDSLNKQWHKKYGILYESFLF